MKVQPRYQRYGPRKHLTCLIKLYKLLVWQTDAAMEGRIGQLEVFVVMGHWTCMNFKPCSGKTRYPWGFPDQHEGHQISMRATGPAWGPPDQHMGHQTSMRATGPALISSPAVAKQGICEGSHKPALNAPRRQQQRGSRWRWSAPCAHRAVTTLWSCAPSPGRPAASPSLHLNTVTWLKWKADHLIPKSNNYTEWHWQGVQCVAGWKEGQCIRRIKNIYT